MKNRKSIVLMILAIVGLIAITISVTYAFFSYTKEGTTENTVKTGTITFLYTEIDQIGAGISLVDAFPISDSQGKALTGEGKVFDFKITSDTPTTASIPYEITARKKIVENMLDEDAVKIYLTKVTGESEEEVLLDNYNKLKQTSNVDEEQYIEKVLYTGKISANKTDYEQAFRLRMWVDEDVDFSPIKDENGNDIYPYNGKTFTVTVNVYANAKVVTEEDIIFESNTNISSLSVEGTKLETVSNKDYDYEASLPLGTTSTTIDVETENPYATVNVEKIDSLAYGVSNIQRLAIKKQLDLTPGDNYFRITVTGEDKETIKDYKIKITVESSLTGDSILSILEENDLGSGYHTFKVNGQTYPVHLIVYNGDTTFSSNQKFGDSGDIATASTNAQNMVIVKVNGDLTINSGVKIEPTYSAYGGPKGFTLFVTGTLTNNGTIDNSHGAKAAGQNVYLWKNADGTYEYVPAIGGNGATAVSGTTNYLVGKTGTPGSGRQTGGGGSGATRISGSKSGAGGSGTSYSGGSGGGGAYYSYAVGGTGSSTGGSGGKGYSTSNDGGGAGNPGGTGNVSGSNGTGGLLIICANNYVNNGIVSSNGSNGGAAQIGGGGGSSGGGSINIFYTNTLTRGTVQRNGGAAVGTIKGGEGGAGTVTYKQISFE